MKSVEIESKLQLDCADWEQLKKAGRIRNRTEQLNVYYDCGRQLVNSASTFRIRYTIGAPPIVTLKILQRIGATTRESVEYEHTLARVTSAAKVLEEDDLPPSFRQPLRELGISKLHRVGWMRTERWLVELPGGTNVELDRVALPNGDILFEVEVEESRDEIRESAVAFISSTAESAQASSRSKFERFFEAVESVGTLGVVRGGG